MNGLLVAIFVLGAVTCSQTARTSSLSKLNRDLTGNECKGHPHGDRIPYPGDCGKFLVCEYYSGTVMTCPDSLHFNPVLQVCDYPTSAGCSQETIPTPTEPPGTPPTAPETQPPTPTEPPGTPSTPPATEPTTEPPTPTEPPGTPSTPLATEPTREPPTPTEPPSTPSTPLATEPTREPSPQTPTESHSTAYSTPSETAPTLNPNENICFGKKDGSLAPFPYDCNWYVRCEDSSPLVISCPDGKLFNAVLLICDYPENVNCIATPYPTTTTPDPPTEPTTTELSTTEDPTPAPTTESDNDFCIDQPDNTLLPYPCDCKWYIRCENNCAHFEICKDGRVFNSDLQICDFPENTECNEGQYPAITTPTSSSSELPASTTTQEPVQRPTNPPYVGTGICEDIERGTLLPYPGRCDLYIKCIEPAPTTFSCPSGLEFNPEAGYCQKVEEAGCSIPRVTSEPTTITEPTKPYPPKQPGICSDYPIGDLIPYPGNCSQFIKCDVPIPTAEECPIGLEFNARLGLCEPTHEAGCSSTPVEPPITPETPTTPSTPSQGSAICKDKEDGELVAYPGDCKKFIICEQPIPSVAECTNGLIFNPDLGICDEPTDTECISPTLPPPLEYPTDPAMSGLCKGHQSGDLVGYPDSCTKYVRCTTPAPVAGTCKDGQLFNDILGICDQADSVDCNGYVPTSTPNPGDGTTTEPSVPTNPTNGVCQGHSTNALIPYPGDCRKFIKCSNPVPYAKTCENGFHFNAKLSICDNPEAAECENVIITTTSQPPTSSGSNICCGAENGTLVAFPDDCTLYIQCLYPIPIALQCQDGLHYNSISQECESIESAACQWYVTTTIAPVTCEDKEDGAMFAYSGDCKKYYMCSDGAPVLLPCTIGAIFDSAAGECVPGDVCP